MIHNTLCTQRPYRGTHSLVRSVVGCRTSTRRSAHRHDLHAYLVRPRRRELRVTHGRRLAGNEPGRPEARVDEDRPGRPSGPTVDKRRRMHGDDAARGDVRRQVEEHTGVAYAVERAGLECGDAGDAMCQADYCTDGVDNSPSARAVQGVRLEGPGERRDVSE
jgi:hypothetical protein